MRAASLAAFMLLVLGAAPAARAFDANGVTVGASEAQVKKAYPAALCKPLEWQSPAADRRCDDAKVAMAGVTVRVTFYLKKNAVEGFDIRFERQDLERFAAHLKERYGKPVSEVREQVARSGREPREVYKIRWERGDVRAVLTAQMERRRGSLAVSRGDFDEAIYRIQ